MDFPNETEESQDNYQTEVYYNLPYSEQDQIYYNQPYEETQYPDFTNFQQSNNYDDEPSPPPAKKVKPNEIFETSLGVVSGDAVCYVSAPSTLSVSTPLDNGVIPYPEGYFPAVQESMLEKTKIDNLQAIDRLKETAAKYKKEESSIQQPKERTRLIRSAGGEQWIDDSLHDWDPKDFRIFCGDLGPEVGDDVLARAFQIYPSFQRARVVRNRKSLRSKGYGFVSFKDPSDYSKALKEMNGKYVGSRPIKLTKSTWDDRTISVKELKKIPGSKKLLKKLS